MSGVTADFSDDVLGYLREHRGQPVRMMTLVSALARRISDWREKKLYRGKIMSDISKLVVDGKVIRYRKTGLVPKAPQRSEGLLRISEKYV